LAATTIQGDWSKMQTLSDSEQIASRDDAPPLDATGLPPRPKRRFAREVPARLRTARNGNTAAVLLRSIAEQGGLAQPQSSPEAVRRDATFRRSLAVADVLAAGVAVYGALALAGATPTFGVLAALPLVVLVGKVSGLYDQDEDRIRKSTLDDGPALFQAATLYALLVWLADGWLVDGRLDRLQVLELWLMMFVLMVISRACTRRLVGRLTPTERVLVLGDQAAAERLRRKLAASHNVKAEVVGFIPLLDRRTSPGGTDVPGGIRRLAEAISERRVHRVVVAPTESDQHTLDTIRLVKSLGVKVSVLPRLFEVVGSSVKFDDVDGLILLGVPRYGLTTSSRLVKRAADLTGALAGLVLLAPLFCLVALAVRLETPGPAFFRQRRIGRDGREFTMFKFRTMITGAEQLKSELLDLNESDGLFKMAADPRVTRVGRLLRRTSIDELPQLLNVVRGEMSLVGPRPLVPDEDSRVEGWQRRRLIVMPGMTGVWQILGSARVPLQEMVKLDYLYAANWSPWLDAKILLRTVLHVGRARGL
jgi:exopolysaccharide biosynthesis polyprenyl glycosylphosphotransferase